MKKQGGKRKGAGRNSYPFARKTVSFRIRLEWIEEIKQLVNNKIKELEESCKN